MKFGKYSMNKTIGQGTFGKVKLANHIPTGEKVAIKILEKKKLKDTSDVERVSREIKILRLLSHSNIVQLYEVIETPELILLVLEYASGGELFDYIVARTRLSEDQACRFYHQIIDAVEYIHRNKVVHRDLKPENLLLDEKNNIKLADFGLSNIYNVGREMDTPCGSPCYAAPEMVAGKTYKGLEVDIWSSGVVLYAMVCGFLPFEDPSTPVLYQKIISGKYEEPEWLSNNLKDLLRKVLNTDPRSRYRIEDIRNHPWMAGKRPENAEDMQVDQEVIRDISEIGVETNTLLSFLNQGIKNSLTTFYFLLSKKKKSKTPRPPSSSYQKIQQMHRIRYIDTKKDSRPVSRIKIVAKSVTPKFQTDSRNSQSRSRRVYQPKEPGQGPEKRFQRNNRVYKPVQGSNNLNLSYRITPSREGYKIGNFGTVLTPKY